MLLLMFVVVVLLAYLYLKYSKVNKYWAERNVKFVKPVLLLGNMSSGVFRRKCFADAISGFYNAFPEERYVGIFQFTTPSLLIRDPKLIKQITIKDFDVFPEHISYIDEEVDPLWAKNLASTRAEKWREMRPTLSPAFTSSKMKMMFHLMKECTEQFTNYFLDEAKKDILSVDTKDAFTRYANDVIATTAFGIKCDSLQERSNEFYVMGKDAADISGLKIFKFFAAKTFGKLFNLKLFSHKVRTFFQDLISENIRKREEEHIIRHDMIQLLMDARKGYQKDEITTTMDTGFATAEESPTVESNKRKRKTEITDEDITAQALFFFLAGFDTSATLMCYLAHELALNPEMQKRLRDEVDSTYEECGGGVNYEGLMSMKYMDMVVTETLRKWPPTILTDRISVRPYAIEARNSKEQPLYLDTGSMITLPIYAIHRDANNYPNPEKFDPDRFSDENKHKLVPNTYLPFGIGPRNCIGSRFALMEAKLIIFQILRTFEITVVDKTPIPVVLCTKSFNMIPKGGFWVGFKRRVF